MFLTMILHLMKRGMLLQILVLVSATVAFASAKPTGDVAGPFRACWSPDSFKVTFILAKDGARDTLYVSYSDASNARVLLEGEQFQDVAWAPDGEHVAVGSAPSGSEAVVHVVEVYNDGRESISLGQQAEHVELRWSADSTRLVVQLDDSILLVSPADKSVDVLDDADPPVCRVFFEGPPPLSPDNKLLLAAGPVYPLALLWEPYLADADRPLGQASLYAWLVKVEGEQYTLPVAQYGSLAGPLVWAPTGKAAAFMTRTAPGRSEHSPRGAIWMNVVSDVGTPRIGAKKVIDPLSRIPVWSPAGDSAGYFWRDATGKSFFNYVNVAFTTVLPLEEVFDRVVFAAWNEPENIFLVAVTRDGETVCGTVDVGYFGSGEIERVATVNEPFDRLLPSPNLSKLLLRIDRDGEPAFAIFDLNTGKAAQLMGGTSAE